jgi:hypothetical protein
LDEEFFIGDNTFAYHSIDCYWNYLDEVKERNAKVSPPNNSPTSPMKWPNRLQRSYVAVGAHMEENIGCYFFFIDTNCLGKGKRDWKLCLS